MRELEIYDSERTEKKDMGEKEMGEGWKGMEPALSLTHSAPSFPLPFPSLSYVWR